MECSQTTIVAYLPLRWYQIPLGHNGESKGRLGLEYQPSGFFPLLVASQVLEHLANYPSNSPPLTIRTLWEMLVMGTPCFGGYNTREKRPSGSRNNSFLPEILSDSQIPSCLPANATPCCWVDGLISRHHQRTGHPPIYLQINQPTNPPMKRSLTNQPPPLFSIYCMLTTFPDHTKL